MKKRFLILENGAVFEGVAIGAEGETVGELVFTTGMCGYMETLTDPSYFGQIVMQTFPMIGNYGAIEQDEEGECCLRGYVVNELCGYPSNFRSEGTLNDYLVKKKIIGISGVDTRELTKIIRESGVLNAALCDTPYCEKDIKGYSIKDAVKSVSRTEPTKFGKGKYKVALMDYGEKRNILRELLLRDTSVTVFPYNTKAEVILDGGYNGVMLSNGPGDPAENTECISELKKLLGKLPVFGVCLGHQLMALATGGSTVKMKYGHRGVNQPVKEINSGKTYITSQNHGYAVVNIKVGKESYTNANDGTCEGVDYAKLNAFSVQFHPEACSGPRDTSFLFDKFVKLMENNYAD